ncbi:MAG: GNAT family N-acetyltransferase [Chitinophagaceae bacterium]|nr:GNAT family N-acetyltransferase [Chitinophagaceae bacterium]
MTNWTDKKFEDLKPGELYAILQLRSEVFVVEQNCAFQDMDGKDKVSHHLMGWQGDKLVAYSRIVPAGISYVEFSIGRIVSSPAVRRQGIGRVLVDKSIQLAYSLHGKGVIRIGAQYYLRDFYESFGFRTVGDIYLEDDIEHIEMLLLTKD